MDENEPVTEVWLASVTVGTMNTRRPCYRLVSGVPIGVCPAIDDLPTCLMVGSVVAKLNVTQGDVESLLRVFGGR